jgi:amidase
MSNRILQSYPARKERLSSLTDPQLHELTIASIQQKFSNGELTSMQLTQYYLERIASIDRAGPCLNSVIEANPDALAIASGLDDERRAGKIRGALHGIPIILKDNIDTHDRLTTTAGSLALQGSLAGQDAFLVERLRTAGALVLAKANLSEWANFRSTHSTSGWSSRGGQVKNPYALDRNPCGSSSGSAVAVAADLCSAAVGTETDGSIVCPAHTNGVVGIKPTLGLISRSGVIPIAHSQDTAGPLARTVADAAVLLGAMTGVDPRDPATSAGEGRYYTDYTQFLDPDGLKDARIGVARNYFGANPRADQLIENAIQLMQRLGAEIVDPANIESDGKWDKGELEVLLYEFKADLNAYLAGLDPAVAVHSLEELIAFNEKNKAEVMPFFGQERFLAAQKKGPLSQKRYLSALVKNHRLSRAEGIDAVLFKHNLDALVCPTGGPAWLTDWVNGDHYSGPDTSSAAAVAGYPHITVPAGYLFGLPVGVSFIGAAWQEPRLIKVACAFEQASQARQAPQFLPTLG